ncbi:MAG: DMT family transporter [Nitrospiraceae bacterium]|nr:DMT family transporter [Nitrospiraceae bacterium]
MNAFYILTAIILWSSLGVFVRIAEVPVQTIMFYSVLAALIIQSAMLTHKSYRQYLPPVKDLKFPILLGIVSLINTFTFYFAYKNTTIANAILTHYTAPVIVAFLAPFLLKEKITLRILTVIVIASTGLWIMLNGFSPEKGHGLGIIAGLVSGFMYAMLIIILRAKSTNFHPLALAFLSNLVIVLLLSPFIREFPIKALWIFITMGIVHSTIAPVLYFKGLQTVSANKAAVLGYMEPVMAIILSAIFLSENPGANTIIGGLLIILSGCITLIKKQNKNSAF